VPAPAVRLVAWSSSCSSSGWCSVRSVSGHARLRGLGGASQEGGTTVRKRPISGRCRSRARGLPPERESLVCRVVRGMDERSVKGRPRGASSEALAGPAEASRHRARKGPALTRLPDRSLDAQARRRGDREDDGGLLSPGPCMEGAARAVGLEPSATGTSCGRAPTTRRSPAG